MGRIIQSRAAGEPVGMEVVADTYYDPLGRVLAQSVPYYAALSSNYSNPDTSVRNTTHVYDAVGRENKTINTDGTVRTQSFYRWNTTVTDENGHSRMTEQDAFGRIVSVYEYNGGDTYTTRYRYDGQDNLLNITDNEGNKFRFDFDSLGRRTGLRDPDLGNWTFGYDAVGNLVNQTDARGTMIKFEYDGLNRLTEKDYPSDVDVVLSYDTGVLGALSQANSSAGSVRYDYDRRMRLTSENYTRGSSSWKISHGYDAMDRLTSANESGDVQQSFQYNSIGSILSHSNIRD